MISRRIIMGVVVTGAAAATVVGLATPAYAAVANIVSVGGSTATGSVAVAGKNTTGAVTLTKSDNSATVTCPTNSTTVSGTAFRGANSSGTAASVPASGVAFGTATYSGPATGTGSITAGSAPCTTSGGTIPVAVKACNTYQIQTTAPSTTAPHPPTALASGQTTPGGIPSICADVYIGKTNSCYTRVTGSVSGTYKNNASDGTLTVTPTVTLTGGSTNNPSTGCVGGAFGNGTQYKFAGAFSVTSASGVVWVNA